MNGVERQRLAELESLVHGATLLDAIAIAIAIEQSFDLVLEDVDISPERLCSPGALADTLGRYLGGT